MNKAARRNRQAGHVGNKVGKEGLLVLQRERVEAREDALLRALTPATALCWECGGHIKAGETCPRCLP